MTRYAPRIFAEIFAAALNFPQTPLRGLRPARFKLGGAAPQKGRVPLGAPHDFHKFLLFGKAFGGPHGDRAAFFRKNPAFLSESGKKLLANSADVCYNSIRTRNAPPAVQRSRSRKHGAVWSLEGSHKKTQYFYGEEEPLGANGAFRKKSVQRALAATRFGTKRS